MNSTIHRLLLTFYFTIISATIAVLSYFGGSYYRLPESQRYFTSSGQVNVLHELLNPSGLVGHGLGIVGSTLIVIGLFGYMIRKRYRFFSRWGVLKYWLELHIFLCTLGSVMVLFHTSFKFGGIISIGFWSLAIVWSSGVIGRFIYLQIPQSIEGRDLSLQEIKSMKEVLDNELKTKYNIDISALKAGKLTTKKLKILKKGISNQELRKLKRLIRSEYSISKRIERLDLMKNLFRYWHVIHLPFALIMLIIMIIHISISLFFGYKWIF